MAAWVAGPFGVPARAEKRAGPGRPQALGRVYFLFLAVDQLAAALVKASL